MYMSSELFCFREEEVILYYVDLNYVILEYFFRYLYKCSSVLFCFYSLIIFLF